MECVDSLPGERGNHWGAYHDATIENAPYNCSSGAGGLGKGNTLRMEGGIAGVVGEVETWHLGQRQDCTGDLAQHSKFRDFGIA